MADDAMSLLNKTLKSKDVMMLAQEEGILRYEEIAMTTGTIEYILYHPGFQPAEIRARKVNAATADPTGSYYGNPSSPSPPRNYAGNNASGGG